MNKRKIVLSAIVWGVIIGCPLLILAVIFPIVGFPLLAIFLLAMIGATVMKLKGIKTIHPLREKFIERD